jgi:putative acetyltransferase
VDRELEGLVIQPETPDLYDAIGRVVASAFGSTAEPRLVELIRASPGYVPAMALVACIADEVVGHVMVSEARLRNDEGERRIGMLSPLAVNPRHQRRGIGSALVRTVLDIAQFRGEPLVVLEGSPTYYGRLGFEHSVRHGIEILLPDWAPPEAAQVMCLASYDATDPSLKGTVIYPPAFDPLG